MNGRTARLTERQRQILVHVVAGDSNVATGGALGLSERTVEGHVRVLCLKAGVESRLQLAVLAAVSGWGLGAPIDPASLAA